MLKVSSCTWHLYWYCCESRVLSIGTDGDPIRFDWIDHLVWIEQDKQCTGVKEIAQITSRLSFIFVHCDLF